MTTDQHTIRTIHNKKEQAKDILHSWDQRLSSNFKKGDISTTNRQARKMVEGKGRKESRHLLLYRPKGEWTRIQKEQKTCACNKGNIRRLGHWEDHAQDKPEGWVESETPPQGMERSTEDKANQTATPGRLAQPAESQNKCQRNKTPYSHDYNRSIVQKRLV